MDKLISCANIIYLFQIWRPNNKMYLRYLQHLLSVIKDDFCWIRWVENFHENQNKTKQNINSIQI